jgi:SAM-dependent methyltransferase
VGGGDSDDVIGLALGRPAPVHVAEAELGGAGALSSLLGAGGAERLSDGRVVLPFEVLSDGGAMAIRPRPSSPQHGRALQQVYAGADSWLLVERAWRFGLGGGQAVDLGTGTGLVATFLSTRYHRVLATDIDPGAVATATLSRFLLDERRRSRIAVSTQDVGVGLRPASFDLVTANTPWVPTSGAAGQRYADGGPTGFELPGRFLSEGAGLLAPGGVLVVLCADLRFRSARAPLDAALDDLEQRGFTTRVDPTPAGHPSHGTTAGAAGFLDGLVDAHHVTVVVHRPGPRSRRPLR